MKTAMRDIQVNGKGVNSAAKAHNIPELTLRRYLKKYPADEVKLISITYLFFLMISCLIFRFFPPMLNALKQRFPKNNCRVYTVKL